MDEPYGIEVHLINYIDIIDKEMNSQFNIIDSKTEKFEKFKSERLIHSLVMIGVPLTHALKTLNIVTNTIIRDHKEKDLKTFYIRRIIRDTLYALHSEKENIDAKNSMMWGDAYIRRYGNQRVL